MYYDYYVGGCKLELKGLQAITSMNYWTNLKIL